MRHLIRARAGRALAIFLSISLGYGSASAGVNASIQAALHASQATRNYFASDPFGAFWRMIELGSTKNHSLSMVQNLSQGASQYADIPYGYSEPPRPVNYGPNPSRDFGRAGVWNAQTLAALQYAELQWGASPTALGASASIGGLCPGTTGDQGGGRNFPWEAKYVMGIAWFRLNTNTGNVVTNEHLFGFPSLGDTGVDITLYHNSQSTYNGNLGPGWSTNYDATTSYDQLRTW